LAKNITIVQILQLIEISDDGMGGKTFWCALNLHLEINLKPKGIIWNTDNEDLEVVGEYNYKIKGALTL